MGPLNQRLQVVACAAADGPSSVRLFEVITLDSAGTLLPWSPIVGEYTALAREREAR